MTNITPLHKDREESFNQAFADFMKHYPHHRTRRNRAKALSKFQEITKPNAVTISTNRDSGRREEIPHDVTAEQLAKAAWNYRLACIPKGATDYKPDRTYVPAAEVWLNSGAYTGYLEDWTDE